jgi:hypothetical protein
MSWTGKVIGSGLLVVALLAPATLEARILRYIDTEGIVWFVEEADQAPVNQRQTSTPRELNLLRHYRFDLRLMIQGHACLVLRRPGGDLELPVGYLQADVGCLAFNQVLTALAQRDFTGVVHALDPALQFSEAERQAWLRWLPKLVRDEMRPTERLLTWQKAGVQR